MPLTAAMTPGFPETLPLPLQQSPQYARALRMMGASVQGMTLGRNTGWCQIQTRKLRALGEVRMISRGPVWAEDAPSLTADWLRDWLRAEPGRPLVLNAGPIAPGGLQKAGFWPVMTGASVAMLPLAERGAMRAGLSQKWRNRLNRAEAGKLTVQATVFNGDPAHWLLAAEEDQRRRRRYGGLPRAFTVAYARANPGDARLFCALLDGRPVAAMLFLRHGQMATYHLGHAKPDARALNAHNLLMWHAMCWLAERGHRSLDLGTINTQDAAGLARFKLGTGARALPLGGTWLHLSALAPIARRLPSALAA